MASTPQFRNGVYQVKWRKGSSGKWQTCSFVDEDQAWQAKRIAEDHDHRISREEMYRIVLKLPDVPTLAVGLTFGDFARQWMSKKKGVELGTLEGYESMLRLHIMPAFGALTLSSIEEDADLIQEWVNQLEDDLSATSIAHNHALLYQILDAAIPKYISHNPASKTELPKDEDPFEPVYLTRSEADLLVSASPEAIRDLVRTALGTGMRLGELVALRIQDVKTSADRPSIAVTKALKKAKRKQVGPPKSRKSRRTLTISRALADVLKPRVIGRRPEDLVFPSPMGMMWSQQNLNGRYWKRAVASASHCATHPPAKKLSKHGKELRDPYSRSFCACPNRLQSTPRLHDLRHTHAGWLIEEGWDLHKLQLRMGHESIKTTYDRYGPRYRDVNPDALDDIGL